MAQDSFYEAYVAVIPTAKGFERSLGNQIAGPSAAAGTSAGTKAGGTFVAGFGKMIPLLAGVLAAAGVGNLIGDAITNASDVQQAQGAVEDVFGKLGLVALESFAAGGAANVGQSMGDILSSAKDFGIFGKAAGLADDELVDFSTNLITLGADLSAFANTSPEEAVTALAAGLRGESEPLRKYGVLLDDATLRIKAMEMGIYDGNGSLTQQQRILAANAVIFDQTAIQQGKFAAESNTLAGRQAILAAGFENVSATIGTTFLPVMEDLLGAIVEHVLPALEQFAAWLQEPATKEGIAAITAGIGDFIGKLVLGAQQISDFFGGLMRFATEAGVNLGIFAVTVQGWINKVAGFFDDAKVNVGSFFLSIGGWFAAGAQQVGAFAGAVGARIGEAIGFFQSLPGRIGEAIGGLGNLLYNSGRSIVGSFVDGIRSMIGAVASAVGGVMDFVAGFFPNSPAAWGPLSGSGWTAIKSAGVAISNQFASGIESDYSRVRTATTGLAAAAVPQLALEGASIGGTLEIGGDGLARIIDGRFTAGQAAASRTDNAGRRVRFA